MKPVSGASWGIPATPPGAGALRRTIRRGALGMAFIGMACCFILAYAGLMFFSNRMTVYPQGTAAPLDFDLILCFELFLVLVFFSVFGLFFRSDSNVMRFRREVLALCGAPFLLFPLSIFIVHPLPTLTSVLAVLPPMGVSIGIYSMASSPVLGLDPRRLARLRFLVCLQLAMFLAIAAIFTPRGGFSRTASLAFVFPGLLFLGFLVAVLGLRVREAAGAAVAGSAGEGSVMAREPAAREVRYSRPGLARSTYREAALFLIFLAALSPALWLINSPAQPVIAYSEAGDGGLIVTVVNRGAQAAAMIELWGDGQYITTIHYIDGFGIWEVRGLDVHGARRLTLRFMAQDVSSQNVWHRPYVPEACSTIWFVIGIAAASAAVPRALRKARK